MERGELANQRGSAERHSHHCCTVLSLAAAATGQQQVPINQQRWTAGLDGEQAWTENSLSRSCQKQWPSQAEDSGIVGSHLACQ